MKQGEDILIKNDRRSKLVLSWNEYKWPLLFLLSMSMLGLKFPLGFLFVPLILINRFRNNRYDFLIMLTIFFGGFGFIGEATFPVKTTDICFIISLICIAILKKDPFIRKTLLLIVLYAGVLLLLAMFSEETLAIQIRTIRNYLFFIYFIVPIVIFTGYKFEITEFFKALMPYVIIVCAFYVIDGFIINGAILLPNTYLGNGLSSTFYDLYLAGFGSFPRKYPPGLFICIPAIFAVARLYKLSTLQWVIIFLAFGACRTFTVICGFILTYILCGSGFKRVVQYSLGICILMGALVAIDALLPEKENEDSPLRLYSSIKQITDLRDAMDDEDIAQLGSGRMAQIIPKFELVSELGKQWTGLGFLHSKLTTNPKFIITNELYVDVEQAEEVATGIEVGLASVYVTCGYIGLLCFIAFFVFSYCLVRQMKFSFYYLSCLFACFVCSFGGFATLNSPDGLIICSLAYAVVYLAERNKNEDCACDMRPANRRR